MSRTRRRSNRPALPPVVTMVDSLAHDGRGVAHVEGKTVFIEGALGGEEVRFSYLARHRSFDEGKVEEVLKASPLRVEPRCSAYAICGGCSLQHMSAEKQIEAKQNVLLENLDRIGKVKCEQVLAPLTGLHWGYRRKARLSAKFVRKKQRVLVGFREKHKPYIADMTRCEVLHPAVGHRLEELETLISSLQARERIAQIEVAVADNATALVFRNLDALDSDDEEKLKAFGRHQGCHIYLQPGGPETVTALEPCDSALWYRLEEENLELHFEPTDFTQINFEINRQMVQRALGLLEFTGSETVLDLFCGIGNFTLPLARHAREVIGVEGDAGLVRRAEENAKRNGVTNARFYACNLAEDNRNTVWGRTPVDRILLDPPRAGAIEVLDHLASLGAGRIVYISCHPGTLARDAGELVNRLGYRLKAAGVMDMFPHTAHVESIAVFER